MNNVTLEISRRFAEQFNKKQETETFSISSSAYLEDALVMCGKGKGNRLLS